MFPDRGRNVSTARTMPGKWHVNLSFPGEAAKSYVVALSAAGTRPGVALPDGRRIQMNVDTLTALSINGLLAPIFTGQAGKLNASGAGIAFIDARSLLPAAQGVRVWIVAVTFDGSASLGIETISDPHLLIL